MFHVFTFLFFHMSLITRYLDPALVQRLNALQLSARSVVEGTTSGRYRSPVRGASIEFRQHRPYARGDEPRRLDWRILARTDRPYVKEYDEETNLRAVLMLDASGSMRYAGGRREPKFDYAAKLVASLAYLMLGQTESVGLGVYGAKLAQWLAPRAGTAQLARVIDVLERASAEGSSDPAAAMHAVAERIGRRSLIVVVSDFFAPVAQLRSAFARLAHDRHEIIALRVLDDDEIEFPFRNWTRLNGMEGESPRLVEPALMRRSYLAAFDAHRRELAELWRRFGVEAHTFMTGGALDVSLIAFLRHRAGIS
jgi:uncharacterized protein (DUF58 family)